MTCKIQVVSISIDLNARARKNLNNRIWGFEMRQLAKRP